MTPLTPPVPRVAIILAGGRSRRMGGLDKTTVDIGGSSPLQRVLEAVPTDHLVVVGPASAVSRDVLWVLEEPRFAGPVAAVEQGLRTLEGEDADVLLLAADMPHLRRWHLERLVTAGEGAAGGRPVRILVNAAGRREHLCSVWPLRLLRERLAAIRDPVTDWRGLALRTLLEGVPSPHLLEVTALREESEDIDTPEDLAAARRRDSGEGGRFG